MGIAIEPVEPCYDSDCYYARGETLTWWPGGGSVTPPEPPSYEPPYIDPSPSLIDYTPTEYPPPPPSPPSPPPLEPPPSQPPTPPEEEGPQPLAPPEGDDPLYRAIGSLLASRPAPAQATPVVVQGKSVNPWPVALVGLAAIAAIGYVMVRRSK